MHSLPKEEGEVVLKRTEEIIFPFALKHFLPATNLMSAHIRSARVRFSWSVVSSVILASQRGADRNQKVKGKLSGSIHFLIRDSQLKRQQHINDRQLFQDVTETFTGGLCLCKVWPQS